MAQFYLSPRVGKGVSEIAPSSSAAGMNGSASFIPSPKPVACSRSLSWCPLARGWGGGKAVSASKQSKKSSPMDRNSDEYWQHREQNNVAVKKNCLKSKQEAQDTLQRVNQLKEENERLEAKIKQLTKELRVLKDLFLEHAHNLADNAQPLSTETTASNSESTGQ